MKSLLSAFVIATLLLASAGKLKTQEAPRSGPPAKSDRENAGLHGAVRTVRTEIAKISKVSDKLEEGPRRLVSIVTYDMDGQITEWTHYEADGSFKGKGVSLHDALKRRIGATLFGPDGAVSGRNEVTLDAQGKISRVTTFKADGGLLTRTDYAYDSNGNKVESTVYEADGSQGSRKVYRHDGSGNVIEEIAYDKKDCNPGGRPGGDDALLRKTVVGYDLRV